MGDQPAGPAAAAAAVASSPAAGSVAGKTVEYVVLDITSDQIVKVATVKIPEAKGREDAVAQALEQNPELKARAAESELALLPIAARLYKPIRVKAETVPASTALRFRS